MADIESLERQILACQENLKHIKAARKAELAVIEDYKKRLRDITQPAGLGVTNKRYTVDGLQHGIERAKINMANLDAASKRERDAVKRLKAMIDSIHEAEAREAEAEANINIILDS